MPTSEFEKVQPGFCSSLPPSWSDLGQRTLQNAFDHLFHLLNRCFDLITQTRIPTGFSPLRPFVSDDASMLKAWSIDKFDVESLADDADTDVAVALMVDQPS